MKYATEEKLMLVIDQIISWKIKEDIDDTLIQKFLSIIQDQGLGTLVFGIFKTSQIEEKLVKLSQPNANPQSLSFAYQIGAILLANNLNLKIINLIELSSVKSYEAVVRDSYWRYLTVFSDTQSVPSLKGTLTTEHIRVALNCLNDESIFVRRSVEKFVIKCAKRVEEKEWIISELLKGLEKKESLEGCVNCLRDILEAESKEQLLIWNQKFDMIEVFARTILSNQRTDIICKVMSLFGAGSLEMYEKIQEKLIENTNFLEIISLAFFVLEKEMNDKTDSTAAKPYLETLISPVKLRLMRYETVKLELSKIETFISTCMDDKSVFRNLLIKSLSCQSKLVAKFDNEIKLTLLDNTLNLVFKIMENPNELKDHKLFNSAINVVLQLVKEIDFEFEDEKVTNLFLKLLESSSMNSSLFHSCSTIISVMFERKHQKYQRNSFIKFGDQFWKKLGEILTLRTLDLQWDIRDSSLEIINTAVKFFNSEVLFSNWIRQFNFHLLIWDLISEEEVESYIRATSLSLLVYLCRDVECWLALKENRNATIPKVAVLLADLLINDPEAFVQRSAIKSIGELLKSQFFEYKMVSEGIYGAAVLSLDWEVKIEILKVIEEFLTKYQMRDEVPNFPLEIQEFGIFQALLKLLYDCDRPVQLRAALFIRNFVSELKKSGFNLPDCVNDDKMELENNGAASVDVEMPEMDANIVESVLDQEMRDKIRFLVNDDKEKTRLKTRIEINEDWTVSINKLFEIDTEVIIKEAEKSSDLYADDIDFILDDILAAAHVYEDGDIEAPIIDCY